MPDPTVDELLRLNARLLESITTADWTTYQNLCDPSLTAFEPEGLGQLVEGMEFHHFYFKLGGIHGVHNTTMASPRVRIMGDVVVVTYVRLTQRVDTSGKPVTLGAQETRIWRRQNGQWKHVHFHRSALPG
jgi:calcium/calmodulin-dependent protein kinase (CaM kinase) II